VNRYRVPKQRVTVRVAFRNQPEGSEEPVELFLSELAETHAGPERPSDVLNREEAFIAVVSPEGGVDVLCRDALAYLAVPGSLEQEQAEALGMVDETCVALSIRLDDGRSLEGVARYRLPESARRLQDFLNQADAFLRLEREDEVLLVNKRCIERIRERAEAVQASA